MFSGQAKEHFRLGGGLLLELLNRVGRCAQQCALADLQLGGGLFGR
jgi:hypothetical protein